MEKYGVTSIHQLESVKEKKKQTCMKHYGVSTPGHIPSVQKKNVERLKDPKIIEKRIEALKARTTEDWKQSAEKAKKTKEERYGKDYNAQFREKAKQTFLAKYGVPYSIEGHEKMKKTNLERYGVEQYRRSKEALKQIKKTKFEKYGGWFNQEAVQQTKLERYGDPFYNNREKARLTNRERFGVDWYCTLASEDSPTVASRPNEEFAKFLTDNGVQFEREFVLDGKRYDFKVGNFLVEINPSATHNSTFGIRNNPKPIAYHLDKSSVAWAAGFECIHVWDWDDWNEILGVLKTGTKTFYLLDSGQTGSCLTIGVPLSRFSGRELLNCGYELSDSTEWIRCISYNLKTGEDLPAVADKYSVELWVPGMACFVKKSADLQEVSENISILEYSTGNKLK